MDELEPAGPPSPPRRRRRRRGPDPAFVAGTSTEFLGQRPLPRAVQRRPLVLVLGPRGVGKTLLATHLLPSAPRLDARECLEAAQQQVLTQRWPRDLDRCPALVLECPSFLHNRPAVDAALRGLLRTRVSAGLRTVLIEAEDEASVQQRLLEAVAPDLRATVVLRFPVGRGRQRFAARVCDELGISRVHVRAVRDLSPWTYERVYTTLRACSDDDLAGEE